MSPNVSPDDFYDEFPRIEEAFQAELDESLGPRGPDHLYEVVRKLGIRAGASVLDLGCGEGRHSIRLAEEFGFAVRGIDPAPRHIELANEELGRAAEEKPELRELVHFLAGSAEEIPIEDESVDLIWCKEVLMHVPDLRQAFTECRRVLRGGGRMLIYHVFHTDRLGPGDEEFLWGTGSQLSDLSHAVEEADRSSNVVSASTRAENVEAAFTGAGFRIDERIDLTSEGGEHGQETTGEPGRRLAHVARLLRDPERYLEKFGRANYDIMLGDCLWHVYRMIGKLSARVYVLSVSGWAPGTNSIA